MGYAIANPSYKSLIRSEKFFSSEPIMDTSDRSTAAQALLARLTKTLDLGDDPAPEPTLFSISSWG